MKSVSTERSTSCGGAFTPRHAPSVTSKSHGHRTPDAGKASRLCCVTPVLLVEQNLGMKVMQIGHPVHVTMRMDDLHGHGRHGGVKLGQNMVGFAYCLPSSDDKGVISGTPMESGCDTSKRRRLALNRLEKGTHPRRHPPRRVKAFWCGAWRLLYFVVRAEQGYTRWWWWSCCSTPRTWKHDGDLERHHAGYPREEGAPPRPARRTAPLARPPSSSPGDPAPAQLPPRCCVGRGPRLVWKWVHWFEPACRPRCHTASFLPFGRRP